MLLHNKLNLQFAAHKSFTLSSYVVYIYSGTSLIRTPLIRMLHYPDDISGNKLYENLSNVIHLSGRFVYPDDFAGNQSVRINEARLYNVWQN